MTKAFGGLMSYQILGLRSYPTGSKDNSGKIVFKKKDEFFDRRWRVENVDDLFTRPKEILDQNNIPEDQRFNLYYTIAKCDGTKRGFAQLEIIAFDIDDIDKSKIELYEAPVLDVLGVKPQTCAVVSSGGGLHFIVKLKTPITSVNYYEDFRAQYKAICTKIDRALETLGLPGKPDPSVWDQRRILRMPGTINKKPGRPDSECVMLSSTLVAQDFDLEVVSGLKRVDKSEAMPTKLMRRMRQADGKAAIEECLFLKEVKELDGNVSEPEWYAAASIVGRFKEGRTLFHEMSKGHPTYSESETDAKLEQALENSGPRTCESINRMWGKCQGCPHYGRIASPVTIMGKDVIPSEATGYYDIFITKDGVEKQVPNYNDLLRAYTRDRQYKAAFWLKSVYEFDSKKYVEKVPLNVKAYSEEVMFPKPSEKIRNEFLAKVIVNNSVQKSWFEESTAGQINFLNGILNLEMGAVVPHTPDVGFTWCLPYEYNPEAECPNWIKFVDDICQGHKESAQNIQEFLGFVVTGGEYKYHKALWLYGDGSNGKSTLIDTIKALIGASNYSVVSIKQIISDRFASADLCGKIANFCEETSPEDLSDSGPFKNLTGNGEQHAQRKYGDSFTFRNRAKFIMTYNEIPKLKDLSHGMLRRPLVIPLNAKFVEGENMDTNLGKKLLSELPGIFNWAMEGWHRLEKQERFTKNEKSDEALNLLKYESDSVAQWVEDFIEFVGEGEGETISTRGLYEEYTKAVTKFPVSLTKFSHRIAQMREFDSRKCLGRDGPKRFNGYSKLIIKGKESLRDKSRGQF